MSRTVCRLFAAIAFAVLPACGVEGEVSPFEASLLREEQSDAGETLSVELEGDGKEASDGEEVTAWVCVGNFCTFLKGKRNGNKLTIELPLDPALVGLDITATLPDGTVFKGTYKI